VVLQDLADHLAWLVWLVHRGHLEDLLAHQVFKANQAQKDVLVLEVREASQVAEDSEAFQEGQDGLAEQVKQATLVLEGHLAEVVVGMDVLAHQAALLRVMIFSHMTRIQILCSSRTVTCTSFPPVATMPEISSLDLIISLIGVRTVSLLVLPTLLKEHQTL
jgi:hypothetical protein